MIRIIRTAWYVLTLRCEEADRIRSIERAGDLRLAERFGASVHTFLCRSCRIARRQARILRSLLHGLPEGTSTARLTDQARLRISESVNQRTS